MMVKNGAALMSRNGGNDEEGKLVMEAEKGRTQEGGKFWRAIGI
jgi:hypothetical protein